MWIILANKVGIEIFKTSIKFREIEKQNMAWPDIGYYHTNISDFDEGRWFYQSYINIRVHCVNVCQTSFDADKAV